MNSSRLPATAGGTRAVVLDCETMPSVDVTAARMLDQLAGDEHPGTAARSKEE